MQNLMELFSLAQFQASWASRSHSAAVSFVVQDPYTLFFEGGLLYGQSGRSAVPPEGIVHIEDVDSHW